MSDGWVGGTTGVWNCMRNSFRWMNCEVKMIYNLIRGRLKAFLNSVSGWHHSLNVPTRKRLPKMMKNDHLKDFPISYAACLASLNFLPHFSKVSIFLLFVVLVFGFTEYSFLLQAFGSGILFLLPFFLPAKIWNMMEVSQWISSVQKETLFPIHWFWLLALPMENEIENPNWNSSREQKFFWKFSSYVQSSNSSFKAYKSKEIEFGFCFSYEVIW